MKLTKQELVIVIMKLRYRSGTDNRPKENSPATIFRIFVFFKAKIPKRSWFQLL